MKSMTGYAFLEKQSGDTSLISEIKSYNSRFLEILINLPVQLSPLEPRIRAVVAKKCVRGKIEVNIRLKRQTSDFSITVNKEALKAYTAAITEIKSELPKNLNVEAEISLDALLNLAGVLEVEKATLDETEAWHLIEKGFSETLTKFDNDRIREGAAAKKNILSHLKLLEKSVEGIMEYLPKIEQNIVLNIKKRFAEILEDKIDENRVLTETAILLMKYTISEEIARLKEHFAEFNLEIERNESPGKKLDFLCQEINREVNTIGSKTPIIEVSKAVVGMKDSLENIREQLRNVE